MLLAASGSFDQGEAKLVAWKWQRFGILHM
jgi:hypothetical protein